MKLYTTLSLLKEHNACPDKYRVLSKHLGGRSKYGADTPITLLSLMDVEGLNVDDVLWSLRAVPAEQEAHRDRVARLFACDCAERVLPNWEDWAKDNAPDHLEAPRKAIEVARLFAEGKATDEEMSAAWSAARAAGDAARSAARAAGDAARSAAWAAGDAARFAARSAAWSAARSAAWFAAWEWQEGRLREYLEMEVAA